MASVYADNVRSHKTVPILNRSLDLVVGRLESVLKLKKAFTYTGSDFHKILGIETGGKPEYPALGLKITQIAEREDMPFNKKALYRNGIKFREFDDSKIELFHPYPVTVTLSAKLASRNHTDFINNAESLMLANLTDDLSFNLEMKVADVDPPKAFFSMKCKLKISTPSFSIPEIQMEGETGDGMGEMDFDLQFDSYMGKASNMNSIASFVLNFTGDANGEGITFNV